MNQIAYFIASSPLVWIVLILLPLLLTVIFSRMKLKRVPIAYQTTTTNGYRVVLYSSHRALTSAPLFTAIVRNSLFPKLVLFSDHIDFTVLIPARKSLTDIKMIDVIPHFGPKSLVIHFQGNPFCFIGFIMNQGSLQSVIQFFKDKNVPLSPRAEAFLHATL